MALHPPRRRTLIAAVAGAVALVGSLGFGALPALAADPSDDATGDITTHGGATRNNGDMTQALRDSIVGGPAKNVILLIGDGMGDSEITVARNYAEGAAGRFAGIDALPLTGQYTTFSLNEDGTPDYASESASTASAWSTGTKTVDGRLSVDVNKKPQATLLEIAKANGLKTGDVSTAESQDATPGAQISHISKRGCYGPDKTSTDCASEALENGGLGSISEQLLNVRPDVVLGGGSASFTQKAKAGPWNNKTLFEQASARGYQLVSDAAGLNAVTRADADAPVLGLFTPGNFPTRWVGPAPVDLTAGGSLPAAAACTDNPARLASGLSLASLTDKAISLLDGDRGFFLQVEGASIDKRDHAADACGQIGETVDLDEAVQGALDFAKADGNTLVVVTADHAHTSQIVGEAIPGLNTHLLTSEGKEMIVAYGTSPAGGSQQHTGSQVRIAGYGPGAANVVGLTDQTDLFFTASSGWNRDLAALSQGATGSAPASVQPGAAFDVTVSGLAADWQATAVLASDPVDLGQTDVRAGVATYRVTAPTEPGDHTLTVTGAQTGTRVVVAFRVDAAAPVDPSPSPSASASAGAVAGSASGNGGDPLALTGGTVPTTLAALALVLVAVGGYLVLRRRHLHTIGS
ncbi:alkaline phosphatase [Microbacterium lacticum]